MDFYILTHLYNNYNNIIKFTAIESMGLRFNTLFDVLLSELKIVKKTIVLLAFVFSCPVFSQNVSIEDIKKEAEKLFEEDEFTKAYKLYSQLVSNYPKDPEYNFKLGVCMIYSEPDKKKCLPYLTFANSKPDEAPKEVKFYLGKAYHVNYLFDEAIKYYNEYKQVGSSAKQKKLQVDREIISCGYGKRLLSNLSDLEVKSKKQLNEADYFRSYDLKDIGGKLLIKPEAFRTTSDKRKKEKSVVFLPRTADKVFFSSYGDNTGNKDLYYAVKLANGEFAKPVKLNGVNTDYDEDYPFLHPNGKTLYFASKGFNSMGGYDIFKSDYIDATDSWSQPVNLEFPINSPDDDYLFVTDSLEKVAYFSTGRQSPPGKIDVLKINTERKIIDILALKGTVVKENADQSLRSKITVKNMGNGEIVGVFEAGENGDYMMDLPNGAKLLYTVETPGLKTQSERVGLPLATNSRPLKQTISYDKGILKIINYFEETPTDDSYLQYLKLIEKKSKLDVNEGLNKLGPQVGGNSTANNTNETNTSAGDIGPTIIDGGMDTTTKVAATKTVTTNTVKSVTNKELADIAKQDANDSKKEAAQLQQDEWDAEQLGEQKKIEADKKIKDGDDILKNAQSITNEDEKNKEIEKGNAIKAEGENELVVANKILNFANTLKEDAANKKKEAILNEQYANELEKINNNKTKDNKESLAKLDDLKNQINQLSSKENTSDNIYKSIKNDIEQKEKEIAIIEKNNTETTNNLNEIKTEVTNSEAELAKTKKKKEKEALSTTITELKSDQTQKEKEIAQNNTELKKLNDELAALKNELDLATKIKTETIAAAKTTSINNTAINNIENTNAINTNTSTSSNATQKITDKTLEEKYKDKITVTDVNSADNIKEVNNQLANYNKEIDLALANNKKSLLNAKTPAAKQQFSTEIKQLETSKKENNQLIAANNKKIQTINADIAKNNNTNNTVDKSIDLNPIMAKNSSDAIKNLDALNIQLNTNDNANFEYNSYQNIDAQKTKVEADSKINDASAQQKKLKDLIASAKDEIQKSEAINNASNNVTPTQLIIEAEELFNKAQKLRTDAQTKTGNEKEKLLNEAKTFDEKGNEKNLQAAEISKNDNNAMYTTNMDNINTLIASGKSSEADINEVKKMNEEAALAYKQATSIREEANSLTNIGAKLGSMSNAEEKEAWALNKQQQALDLLKKYDPTANLKTAITSTSSIKVVKEDNTIGAKLEAVNKGLDELAATKVAAYQKLFEANNLEIEQLNANLKSNETLISNTPSLKSESIAAANKLTAANTLKQKSDAAANNNDKLYDLIGATKKQLEAINQLNSLNKKVTNQIANNNNATNINNTSNTNSTAGNSNTSGNDNSAKTNTTTANNTITENTTANNTNTTLIANTTNTVSNNTTSNNNTAIAGANSNSININSTSKTVDTKTIAVSELKTKDTTATQVVSYFENKEPAALKNPNAIRLKNNALTELKNTEEESKTVENEIKAFKEQNPSNTNTVTPTELKTKADALLVEAEALSNSAAELKNKANNATGDEKNSFIAQANEEENKSQNKKIEASNLTQQSNEIEYTTNNTVITEMLSKLKTDNPTLNTELQQKNTEIAVLKEQAKKLKEEANAQTNPAAKIGALSNAEEKEAELLIKQNQLIAELKKQYPDYVVKTVTPGNNSTTLPTNLAQKQKQVQDKQASELTNLTNALSLEYETAKTYVPKNLSADQKIVKQNADDLNAESKKLLIKSTSEQNPAEKAKLLTLAAKTGDAAVNQLNKITGDKVVTNNIANNNTTNNTTSNNSTNPRNNNNTANNISNTTNNNITANNTNPRSNNNTANNTTANNTNNTNPRNNNSAANNTTNPAVNNTKGTVKIEGLEVVAGNAYNAAKPIPIDAKMQDGLVFRVQIGAFKNQLANDAFKGLSPLNGETVGNGYIRYTAGNFVKFENASAVKNDLRNLGYNDAFVVAYFNGKRITVAEAIALLNKEGKTIDNNASTTAGITANSNVPKNTTVTTPNNNVFNSQEPATVTKELEQTNNLLFTVQIGVYNKQVTKGQLKGLGPIFSEKLPNGLYRYTAGIYNDPERLLTDKRKVADGYVRDAFVSAYLNGKRITFADGKTKATDSTVKLEPQNPIIFPAGVPVNNTPAVNTPVANTPVVNTPINNTPANNTPAVTNTVQPFTNGVTSYPAATAENGIKANEEGVSFKVQIGAYSKQIPNDVAARFSSIKNWPIENKQVNGLFIYNVGNFTEAKFAKSLKEQAIAAGITDAFITVYKDGKKVYGAEATSLLSR
ncbi:MAG: PD40 domain-containing protein [Bacteroidia bacterium]|nr:PD40 domain-containing protein [Bacteroidia bacterium]